MEVINSDLVYDDDVDHWSNVGEFALFQADIKHKLKFIQSIFQITPTTLHLVKLYFPIIS